MKKYPEQSPYVHGDKICLKISEDRENGVYISN